MMGNCRERTIVDIKDIVAYALNSRPKTRTNIGADSILIRALIMLLPAMPVPLMMRQALSICIWQCIAANGKLLAR